MQVKDANRNRRNVWALAITCLVLQVAVSPNIALGNGRANVAFVFAALVALTIGGRMSVSCGFAAGLVFDLVSTGPIGLMALLLTVSSYLLGLEARDRLVDEPLGSFISAAVAAMAVSLAYHLAMLAMGQADSLIDVLLFRVLPTSFLTIVTFLPFVLVLGRHGGSGGGGSHGRHVGRYSIDGR